MTMFGIGASHEQVQPSAPLALVHRAEKAGFVCRDLEAAGLGSAS